MLLLSKFILHESLRGELSLLLENMLAKLVDIVEVQPTVSKVVCLLVFKREHFCNSAEQRVNPEKGFVVGENIFFIPNNSCHILQHFREIALANEGDYCEKLSGVNPMHSPPIKEGKDALNALFLNGDDFHLLDVVKKQGKRRCILLGEFLDYLLEGFLGPSSAKLFDGGVETGRLFEFVLIG